MVQIEELKQSLLQKQSEILNLKSILNIENISKEIEKLEQQTLSVGFWSNEKESKKVLEKIKNYKSKQNNYYGIKENYEELIVMVDISIEQNDESNFTELNSLYNKLIEDIESVKLSTLLNGEYDDKNAVLTFHAGAGGTESQDWVEMLYRMYSMWAEKHGFKVKILDFLDGDEAGIKSISVLIEGLNAYGFLKSESGVHRLVRISPFDSSGRRHTSFASLEVMPEIDDDISIKIEEENLKIDTYRAGGAGGQHVNKTESAVRITHIPTGVIVACQNERSQHQNKEVAMKILKSKLIQIKEREHLEKIEDIKGNQMEIAWGSQIRSYVFMPYTLVKDHRTGFEVGDVDSVMNGNIDGFINAYLAKMAKEDIR